MRNTRNWSARTFTSICLALAASQASYAAIGDVDGDRDVDLSDLATLLTAYGACEADVEYLPGADIDSSGCINLTDLSLVLSNFGVDDCGCPEDVFLDVTLGPGAGPGFPAPTLQVNCNANDELVVRSNGIPHYTFVPTTPSPLQAQNFVWRVPLCPEGSGLPTPLPLLGGIGFSVNGLILFGPNEGPNPAPQSYGDPIFNDIMDPALGHTGPGGAYHFHGLYEKVLVPSGLVANPWLLPDPDGSEASPIIGYAFDGFPIYGKFCCSDVFCSSILEMKSSYVQIGDPTSNVYDAYEYVSDQGVDYLDACNGHYGPDGTYHYHKTDTWPYILGCYHGAP